MKFDQTFSLFEGSLIGACAIALILILVRRFWIGNQLKQFPWLAFVKPMIRISYFALLIFCLLIPFRDLEPEEDENSTQGKYIAKDIYVVLDMSLSMDARDVAPSRFTKAKKLIRQFVDANTGDNLGLIVSPPDLLISEISYDKDYFLNYLNQLDQTIQLSSNPQKSLELVLQQTVTTKSTNERIVLLVSDGDGITNETLEWSKKLTKHNIKLFAIGVGTQKGSKIPYKGTYKKDAYGNFVHTRLNEEYLIDITQRTGGAYANGSDESAIQNLIDDIKKMKGTERGQKEVNESKEQLYFPYLLIALLLILLDFIFIIPLFKLKK